MFAQAGLAKNSEASTVQKAIVVTATKTPYALKDVPVENILVTREDIECPISNHYQNTP